jgi:hypothetical protein
MIFENESTSLAELLLDWINYNDPLEVQWEDELREHVRRGNSYESHDQYWEIVISLIARGLIDDAAGLLRKHSQFPDEGELVQKYMTRGRVARDGAGGAGGSGSDDNLYLVAVQLLAEMPRYHRPTATSALTAPSAVTSSSLGGKGRTFLSLESFRSAWMTWRSKVWNVSADQIRDSGLAGVFDLLRGNQTRQCLEMGGGRKWYEMLIADVFLSRPWITRSEIGKKEEFFDFSDDFFLNESLLHIFRMEFGFLILELDDRFSSFWLPAHLLDILAHCGMIDVPSKEDVARVWKKRVPGGMNSASEGEFHETLDDFREHFLIEYGLSISGHR